ncbi:MAG TPA: PQQ-binding-like beta-propeller repeat protein [Gemmataceae bacterium]|jgi:outer membrane protein assembly factor BamB|nr:PQQ-binding-like beta-propeller repeat protein [Gemmataceae bacterium]
MSSIQLAVLALSIVAPNDSGLDWPQWRGLNRDGVSQETGLLKAWPKDGPKLLWEFDKAGLGYSCFSIVGDMLFTMGSEDDKNGNQEFVLAINNTTGKEKWRTKIGSYFKNDPWGGGPRGTPTIDGDKLYAVGANGDLVCLEADTGKTVWAKNYGKDFKGKRGGWGYAESVLIDGDRLICTPGGPDGAMAALNKKTGEPVWRSTDFTDAAEYVSIIKIEVGGVQQYVTATQGGVYGIRAKDGKKLWSEKVAVNGVATIPTPIFYKDHVFMTSNYGAGCGLIKLTTEGDSTKSKKVYANKAISNHHGGVIRVGEFIYGHSDGGGKWVCLDFLKSDKTDGPEPVSTFKFDKGSAVYADGSLYCVAETQQKREPAVVIKVTPSPDLWKEDGRFTLPKWDEARAKSGGVWAHPVVAHGHLFVRDQNFIWCYDVSGK